VSLGFTRLIKDKLYFQNKSYLNFLIGRHSGFELADYPCWPLCKSQMGCAELSHICTLPGFISPSSPDVFTQMVDVVSKDLRGVTAYFQYRGDHTQIINHIHAGIRKQNIALLCTVSKPHEFLERCGRSTRLRLRKALGEEYYSEVRLDGRFVELYERFVRVKNFKALYAYGESDFFSLEFDLDLLPLSIYRSDGRYIGGSIMGRYSDDTYDYILSCYDSAFPNAGRIVVYESQRYIHSLGYKYLNLGGGTRDNDSLMQFKMSMGAREKTIAYFKLITNVSLFEEFFGMPAEDGIICDYFPPNRSKKNSK
jgi:hypothetical protein